MKDFFKAVWGTREGWAYVGAKNHTTGDWAQRAFEYPKDLNSIQKYVDEHNTMSSVYFCPHLFRTSGRRVKDNSLPTRFLWVDKDAGSLADIEPRPTMCWQTSEGKWQALWQLTDPLEMDKAEVLNKKLIPKTRGDKGGWHAGKYLRVPGSINYKYKPAYHGILLWNDGPAYDAKEFVAMPEDKFDDIRLELIDVPKMPSKIPSYAEAVVAQGRRIPKVAWDLLQATPKRSEDWSEKIWKLESVLLKAEIPIEYVFALVKGSPWNKYERDGRPDEHLWREIYKASKEKMDITPDDALEDLPWMTLDSLLLYAERPQWLVEDIWMEKNVGWIAGEGKSYKSILSLDLALSVASGKPFLNKFQVKEPGPVLMVQEEDPVWRVAHRIQAMADAKGITDIDVAHKEGSLTLKINSTNLPLYISIGGKLTFEDETRMDALERAIASRRPKMVMLDPMFMLSAGMDEFKSGEMAGILNRLKQWRNDYECAIAVVHHYRKSSGADTQKLYGSMALYAWSENSLLVQRESRDTNLVSIRRDIKDAPSDDKLAVEFIDIDETYNFEMRDMKQDVPKSFVADVIKDHAKEGAYFTIKNLQEYTGLAEKTVREHVKQLKEDGLVDIARKGKGGTMTITPMKHLLNNDEDEVMGD